MTSHSKKPRAQRIAEAVGILAESFRQTLTPLTIRAYDVGTNDLEIEAVEAACLAAVMQCKFMPSVNELRALAGNQVTTLSPNDRAMLAWTVVKKAAGEVGSYESVDFDDPIINATIRGLGGWPQLCDQSAAEFDSWGKKAFMAMYVAMLTAGVDAKQTRPLFGLVAASNAASGHSAVQEPKRITSGLPALTAQAVRGQLPKPTAAPRRLTADLVKSLGLPSEPEPMGEPHLTAEEQKAWLKERMGTTSRAEL